MSKQFQHTFDCEGLAEPDFNALVEDKERALETEHGVTLKMTGVKLGRSAITVTWTVMARSSRQAPHVAG